MSTAMDFGTLDARGLLSRQRRGARLAFATSPLNSVAPNEKKNLWHPGELKCRLAGSTTARQKNESLIQTSPDSGFTENT